MNSDHLGRAEKASGADKAEIVFVDDRVVAVDTGDGVETDEVPSNIAAIGEGSIFLRLLNILWMHYDQVV